MPELLPNTKLSHYRLIEKLGAGGMGEVYLAHDTGLGRKLALKLLPFKYAEDADRLQRFKQEARAVSSLNHQNILTIYEIGQEGSTHFIATEFIEGKTLRQRLKESPMKIAEALDVALQVAAALSVAHEAGIIHRDIKPENIMLRDDGHVKVLDFGLAKLMEAETKALESQAPTQIFHETEDGVVMGTAQYMSPEQARGLKVDARTDIFSLGTVLYEMIAGRAPFEGQTKSDLISALLDEREPALLARFVRDVPDELQRIVSKALVKNRDERYQTIKDLLLDLRRLKQQLIETEIKHSFNPQTKAAEQVVEGAPFGNMLSTVIEPAARLTSGDAPTKPLIKRHKLIAFALLAALLTALLAIAYLSKVGFNGKDQAINSLAVLPFVNASANPDTEYLSDGITTNLINTLSQLPNLKVMSRNSVFRYKGRETDAQAAGRELNVRAVLTGQVIQRGDALLINVELVDAQDSTHLWGEQYNRKLSDILFVQEEIARDTSEKLRLKLTGESENRIAKRDTENVEAYRLYLRGQYEWNKYTPEGIRKAIEYYNQAIGVDPTYALAYVGLAQTYGLQAHLGVFPPKEMYPKAKWAAEKALALDDKLIEAHVAMGQVKLFNEWDWEAAEREFKRALELNPNNADAHIAYSTYLKVMTRYEEEIAEVKRALELDPLSSPSNMELAEALYMARRYDEAIAQCQKTIALDPHFPLTYHALGRAYEQKGMTRESITAFEKLQEILGREAMTIASIAHVHGRGGERAAAQKAIDELHEMSTQRYVAPYWMGLAYAGLGDKDQAFAWLEQAIDDRFFLLMWVKAEPRFDPIRSDPRYTKLLRRMNLAP